MNDNMNDNTNDNTNAIAQVIETTKVCIQKIMGSDSLLEEPDAVEYFDMHPVYKPYRDTESLITEISKIKEELLKIQERRQSIIEYKFSCDISQIKFYITLALDDIEDAECKQLIRDILNPFNDVGERKIVRETLRRLYNDLGKVIPQIPSGNRNGFAKLDIEAARKKINPLLKYKAESIASKVLN